jgi:hypothetical protein
VNCICARVIPICIEKIQYVWCLKAVGLVWPQTGWVCVQWYPRTPRRTLCVQVLWWLLSLTCWFRTPDTVQLLLQSIQVDSKRGPALLPLQRSSDGYLCSDAKHTAISSGHLVRPSREAAWAHIMHTRGVSGPHQVGSLCLGYIRSHTVD